KPVLLFHWRSGSLGPLQQVGNAVPQLLPLLPFGFGELGYRPRTSHTGEIRILLPVLHGFGQRRSGFVRLLFQESAPCGQVSTQPIQGLAAKSGALVAVEFVGVLALAAAGQGGSTGGVVAVRV